MSSFFLLGPRGTGKTTWLGERFAQALRIVSLEKLVEELELGTLLP